ncbi:hypothetical protein SACIG1242_2953, partial [Staphylococcus aureus subsp. aureus CIG1242]
PGYRTSYTSRYYHCYYCYFVDRGWTIYEAGTIAILASTIGF